MGEKDTEIKLDTDHAGNSIELRKKISLNNDSGVKENPVIVEQAKHSNEDKEVAADDHDDVPGDFFDDFLKEDFMAGLDVVDEDEGEEKTEVEEEPLKTTKKTNISPITVEEKPEKKQTHGLENNDLRQLLIKEKEKRNSTDLRNVLKGSRKLKKSKQKPINADEFDIRRDPKKTKRDIERDKARCEKDKEKKVISEKLKLVETGLVPPGMEMETDLNDIKMQKENMKKDKREESKSLESKISKINSTSSRRRSNSQSPRRRSPRRSPRKSLTRISFRSPIRRLSPKRSPLRKTSPRRSPRRNIFSISPLRSRERSPRRSPPRRSRERSPPRRSRERSPLRRSRERSPRRSRERSPRKSRERTFRRIREESPRRSRELPSRMDSLLRRSLERLDRDRTRRSRSHDKYRDKYSPRHKRSRSRSPKRRRDTDKKKSFLQEIADKLNETRPHIPFQNPMLLPSDIYHVGPHTQNIHQNPIPAPVPVPVPPPIVNQFQSQQQYDQSFFIGTSPALTSPNVPMNMPNQSGPQMPMKASIPPSNMRNAALAASNDDVSKLFQDNKITLTEFLSITAKPEIYSASTALMKEKIKVISRCQEAIKYLGNVEKKLTGPFVVLKAVKPKSPSDKYKSPLLKSSEIKLPFTEVPKSDEYRSEFNSFIDNLLQNLGLANDDDHNDEDVIVIDDPESPVHQEAKWPKVATAAAPPPPSISFNRQNDYNPPEKRKLSKFIQTEIPACLACDKRKKILFKNVGTQCGNDGIMFSVGTQASDDDFYTRLPKSQSLASLTPAQLLARSGLSKPSRNFDDFDSPFPMKKLPARPTGYGYGGDVFGGGNPSSPSKFLLPSAQGQSSPFEQTNSGGIRGSSRPEINRLSFNNYY